MKGPWGAVSACGPPQPLPHHRSSTITVRAMACALTWTCPHLLKGALQSCW